MYRTRVVRFLAGMLLSLLPVPYAAGQGSPARNVVVADDGMNLVVWSKRPPNTPRGEIILLHGRTWSALPNFDLHVPGLKTSLMDAFVAAGYAVYAVDQRGYGATRRDSSDWLTPDRAVRDAGSVVDWVTTRAPGHRAPVVLGYSRGSMTAEVAAQRRPHSMTALVLYGFPVDTKTRFDTVQDAARPAHAKTTAAQAAEDFLTPDSLPTGVKDAYVRSSLVSDPVRVDWRGERQWAAIDPVQLHTPTLFLSGERDPYATGLGIPDFMRRMTATDRQWVVLSHSDHVAHLERQAAFVRTIVTFLEASRH